MTPLVLASLTVATALASSGALAARRTGPTRRRVAALRPARPTRPLPFVGRLRAEARLDAELPATLEAVAAGLRSGSTLVLAIAAAAEGAGPGLRADLLGLVERAAAVGLVAATDAWAVDRPRPSVRLASAALALSAEVGGAGARALDCVALTLRQRNEAVGEVRALSTQARLSAFVLAAAPVAFAGLSTAADPRATGFLLVDGAGRLCLGAGVGLDAAGALWMARITRAAR